MAFGTSVTFSAYNAAPDDVTAQALGYGGYGVSPLSAPRASKYRVA